MSNSTLFEQVAGLAVIAAFYPPAMLIAAVYLASERPHRTAVAYVLGGFVIVTLVGIIALVAIRAGGLSHVGQHQTRYGLRLGLGVLAIIAAVVLYLRKSKPPGEVKQEKQTQPAKPEKPKKPSFIERMSAHPRPLTAFAVGIVMFGPSITFIAAVQVVATAKAGVAATVGAMVLIIVLTVAFAWLPLVAFLIAPQRTISWINSIQGWLKRHGKTVLNAAVGLVGILLTIQGITGLA